MPCPIDKLRIPPQLDGRRKITPEQKQLVKDLYNVERKGIREITRIVGCSRRSVQFILFPERAQAVKDRAIEMKRWEPYNTKDLRREVMRKFRAKKRDLVQRGLLSTEQSTTTGAEETFPKQNNL